MSCCVLRAACCVLRLLGKTLSFRLERHSRSLEDNVGRTDERTDQCGPLCLSYLLFRYSNFFGNIQRDRRTNGRTGTHIRMSVLTLGTGTRSVRVCGMLLLPQEAVAAVGFKISIHFRCAYAHAHAHVHTHAHPHGHAHVPLIPPAHPLAYAYRVL